MGKGQNAAPSACEEIGGCVGVGVERKSRETSRPSSFISLLLSSWLLPPDSLFPTLILALIAISPSNASHLPLVKKPVKWLNLLQALSKTSQGDRGGAFQGKKCSESQYSAEVKAMAIMGSPGIHRREFFSKHARRGRSADNFRLLPRLLI